jgi:hypothetical protein
MFNSFFSSAKTVDQSSILRAYGHDLDAKYNQKAEFYITTGAAELFAQSLSINGLATKQQVETLLDFTCTSASCIEEAIESLNNTLEYCVNKVDATLEQGKLAIDMVIRVKYIVIAKYNM